ncbi:MAG: sulfotransferase [Geminicoccaceae bacterium]|nr:sulfotransferase [Geminicoccaceae bacterium]
MQPLFLLSLPRSGSTLLQRLLATHPDVATAAEPWFLLPLLYATRRQGIVTEYGQTLAFHAIDQFADHLPGGRQAVDQALARCATDLYQQAANGRRYFLDKTPRYHLVVDQLFELFPEARFVFLWRNPLAVAASIIETWGQGRWNLYGYTIDLEVGLPALVRSFTRHRARTLAIRYEDLVQRPEGELQRLYRHLELDERGDALDRLAETTLPGLFGDRAGTARYRTPSVEPLDKWQKVLANPLRKAWARRYLGRIGRERLQTMGYDQNELLRTLAHTPTTLNGTLSDSMRYLYGCAHNGLELRLMKAKFLRPGDRPRLLSHS